MGSALEGYAAEGIPAFANDKELSLQKAQNYLADLQRLAPLPSLEEIYSREWVLHVQYTHDCAAQKPLAIRFLGGFSSKEVTEALQRLARDPQMDWDEVLRLDQADWGFDEPSAPPRSYPDVRKEMEERKTQKKQEIDKVLNGALEKILSPETSPREKAKTFVLLQSDNPLGFSNDFALARMKTNLYLAQMALALSAYHGEHQEYPAKIADLAPKYLPEIHPDPFSDQDFHYKTETGGYLLYSVGRNGIDDGGKNFLADHSVSEYLKNPDKYSKAEHDTDDIAIRVPLDHAKK